MPPEIEIRFDGRVRDGSVVDLPAAVDPSTIHDAIRDSDTDSVDVDCPQPQPVHDHIGHIHDEMGIRARTALARAGRSRGLTTTYDEQIARLEGEIQRLDSKLAETAQTEPAEFRQRVAEKQATTTELRERVEAARGRLRACRENDVETTAALEELETAISELAEHETAVTAANERLDRARRQRRKHRDLREKRLKLEDRCENLRREARASLVTELREEFQAAVEAVPGEHALDDPFDAPPVVAALAVGHVAALDAPVVFDCDRFDSTRACEWLDTPIVNV